jgi:hypothetical protein
MRAQQWTLPVRLAAVAVLGLVLVFTAIVPGRQVSAGHLYQGGIPLNFDQPVTGALDDQTFRQVYAFTGQADEVVAISMSQTDGDLDPYLLLTDERGNILALSDDDGPGSDALIAFKRIPADGRYFVIATRFGQAHGSTAGEYHLLLEHVGVGGTQDEVLQYGDSVFGRVTQEEPLVFYFLRVQRGDVISVTVRRISGNLDPRVDLATADGLVLVSNDDDPLAEGTLDAGIHGYTVLETGVYLIVATRFGDKAGDTEGSYVLEVAQTPLEMVGTRPEEARLIDYGMSLSSEIDDDVPVRYFRFDAQRGDVITATLTAETGNLDPLLKLADSDLIELAQNDNGTNRHDSRIAAFTLPRAGTYYLIVTRSGEQNGRTSGTFSLQLAGRTGIVGGRALEIVYGATVSGLIADGNSTEEYVFFGQQGDIIEIAMERASGDLDSLITLYDGDRKQIAFDDDSGGDQNAVIKGFVLPRDDMFFLVASRFEREQGTTSGAYLLTLELVRTGGGGE